MLVSTKGRYALRVLVDLAEHADGGYVPLKVIADRQNISEKYLEAVLRALVRSQIIKGIRGKGGGYMLAVPAGELTLGRVLRLTEPSLGTVSCLAEGSEKCPNAAHCRTLPMWKKLDALILDYLDSHTVADLMVMGDGDALNSDGGAEKEAIR
ncbi:MAG: RrF2 family transcriptional regulator [Pyramidobacter sp.]|jgi:Rrf2 family iron-sulfur cluster assembly transcriptional regulator